MVLELWWVMSGGVDFVVIVLVSWHCVVDPNRYFLFSRRRLWSLQMSFWCSSFCFLVVVFVKHAMEI